MPHRSESETSLFTRLKRWLVALCALGLLWLGGAVTYVERVEQIPTPPETRTDAIVVLTGGAVRMATALRLLDQNKAERLLVSGVSPSATKATLQEALSKAMPDAAQNHAGGQGIDLQLLFDCCVDLGYEANDTAGNASETASWAAARGYKSVRIVTANYHMPRALVEFGYRMPGITVVPHPVRSDAMRVEDWWQRRTATLFLLGEYSKYAAALLRVKLGVQLEKTVEQKDAQKASEQKALPKPVEAEPVPVKPAPDAAPVEVKPAEPPAIAAPAESKP